MVYRQGRFELIVGSPPNRRDISVEIYIDEEQWAEVYDDPGHQVVEFFGRKSGKPWELTMSEALDLLKRASDELKRRPRPSP